MTNLFSNFETPSADLLDRYFADACTPTEIALVHAWTSRSRNGKATLEALRQLRIAKSPASWDLDTRWAALASHLDDDVAVNASAIDGIPSSQGIPEPRMKSARRRMGTKTVTLWSSLIGLCTVVVLGLLAWHKGAGRMNGPSPVQWSTYTTAKGKQATIALPDGSVVLLNVASQLDVPTDYDRGNRTLKLTGEALFTVNHHEGNPFTVRAGSSTTRVLGTSFIVRQYATDTAAIIAVRDGKVAVGSIVLSAGQKTVVDGLNTARIQTAAEDQFAFVKGAVTLDDIPLPDAIPELNRWYDTDIRLGDASLATRRVIGSFESGSVTDLVSILELMFDVRVVRDGRVLTLYPRR